MARRNVQVVLRQDVANLGMSGSIVRVRPGYARNFLIPRGMAVLASRTNVKQIEHEKQLALQRLAKLRAESAELAKNFDGLVLHVAKQVADADTGKLFGSVTVSDVVEALAKKGFDKIDRRQIALPEDGIKTTGSYELKIRLPAGVEAPGQARGEDRRLGYPLRHVQRAASRIRRRSLICDGSAGSSGEWSEIASMSADLLQSSSAFEFAIENKRLHRHLGNPRWAEHTDDGRTHRWRAVCSARCTIRGGRVPPNALDAERAVVGGILLENAAMNVVMEVLSKDDFYSEANAQIFEAMRTLFARSQPIDHVTLREELVHVQRLQAVGGDEYLLSLTNTIPTVKNIQAHAEIVREKSIVRRLITACHEIAATGYGDYGEVETFLDHAEASVFSVAKQRARNPYEHVKDVVMRTFEEINEMAKRGDAITGTPTGFDKLDRMTAGMHSGDLIIIAGRPGMGKTAFGLNVGLNACVARKKAVAVFSLEMPKEQLVKRMLCSEAKVDGTRMRTGQLHRDDWPKLANAAGILSELPIWIDDTPALSMLELRAKARRLQSEAGLGPDCCRLPAIDAFGNANGFS